MSYIDDLSATVTRVSPVLLGVSEEVSSRRPAPGKWSAKEILGHLIDSAANNHQRFVRAPQQADLIFPGYDQEFWVVAQKYQDAPWEEIVTLWSRYNRHMAHVMAGVPESVRLRVHQRHNLDQLSWRPRTPGQPATLNELMEDYVAHMHHHLRQIGAQTGAARLDGF